MQIALSIPRSLSSTRYFILSCTYYLAAYAKCKCSTPTESIQGTGFKVTEFAFLTITMTLLPGRRRVSKGIMVAVFMMMVIALININGWFSSSVAAFIPNNHHHTSDDKSNSIVPSTSWVLHESSPGPPEPPSSPSTSIITSEEVRSRNLHQLERLRERDRQSIEVKREVIYS